MATNLCVFTGNLTHYPTTDQVNSKNGPLSRCRFQIAVNSYFAPTEFLQVVCFGKLAENLCEYCTKGSKILIQARYKMDQTQAGQNYPQFIAHNIEFLSIKSNSPNLSHDADHWREDVVDEPSQQKFPGTEIQGDTSWTN